MALDLLAAQITMGQESLAECLHAQSKALLAQHWAEIATQPDIPLDPWFAGYEDLETRGFLRCYVLRDEGLVQGYAVFLIQQSLKYQTSREAYCDLLYLVPRLRRGLMGSRFIQWCDQQLSKDGVQVVRHHVQRTRDFGPVLLRLGYEQEETVYSHRLDTDAV